MIIEQCDNVKYTEYFTLRLLVYNTRDEYYISLLPRFSMLINIEYEKKDTLYFSILYMKK